MMELSSENMKASEDDEVVLEMDVYISKALAECLYLFHYPTKSASAPTERAECLSAKIKPKQSKLEFEFELDVHSPNYNRSRGEQMAFNVDGLNPSGETFFKGSLMDKYLLSGAKAGCSTDNYAVGYVRKGELHITPFHSLVELRPHFRFMDKLTKKALAEEDNDENEEAVAVTVRFEGPNAARNEQLRMKSYQYLQQESASEPWININYHPYGSLKSRSEYANLLCSYSDDGPLALDISPKEYLKELVPECLRLSGYKSVRDEETAILTDHPVSDQIKHLLTNAHVLRFNQILEKLPIEVDPVAVERLVQQFAVLVQGCWVIKSELLYSEDAVSPFTGFSATGLINARDYIVWLYTKSRVITRQEVLSSIYVPDEDLNCMISQIALQVDKGWEFKYPCDTEFIESHQSIEQSQEIKWNLRYKKLVKDLNLGMSDPDGHLPASSALPRMQKRHSRNSLSEGDESGNDSSSSALKDPKSKRVTSPKKKPMASPSKSAAKFKPYHIATLDVSPTFLEHTLSEDVKKDLQKFVEEMIRTQFIMTLSEIKEVMAESHLSGVCDRSDFERLMDETLLGVGAKKVKNKWPQNTTPEPLYAFTAFGNKLDRYRNILLELFSTTARARTNFFVKTVEDELREIISESDCQQIFEDYCVHKSGFYYLKGTISLDS